MRYSDEAVERVRNMLEPLPIFVSYASYDNKSSDPEQCWLDRLMQFLKPLELDAKISTWADTQLTVGTNWRPEIRKAIEKAQVAILIVSPAFLASEFIQTEELPKLLKQANPLSDSGDELDDTAEGMLILPLLIRPCLIDKIEFEVRDGPSEVRTAKLTDFQYVPKGIAMNGLSQYDQDLQLQSIALRILDAIAPEDLDPNSPEGPDNVELDNKLMEFLLQHDRWWFNALRISTWGSKQANFKDLRDFSVKQIASSLKNLAAANRILEKDGKKSKVYKTL